MTLIRHCRPVGGLDGNYELQCVSRIHHSEAIFISESVGRVGCGAMPKDVMSTLERGARIALDDVARNIWLTLDGGGGLHAPGLRAHRQRR